MGIVIIFALVTLLAGFATLRALKNKNILALVFAGGTLAVIGWFTVMTAIKQGWPAG